MFSHFTETLEGTPTEQLRSRKKNRTMAKKSKIECLSKKVEV